MISYVHLNTLGGIILLTVSLALTKNNRGFSPEKCQLSPCKLLS